MRYLSFITIVLFISCSKFEEQNPKLCLTPHIDFVYSNISSDPTGLTIKIDSVVRVNDINKVIWDFGDGSTTTASRPQHKYPKNINKQSYKISLTAENDCGKSIWYKNVEIGGCLPIPDFDVIVSGYTVSFINKSKPGDIPINSYLWNFGNGQSSNLKDPPPITYNSHGEKIIYLTVNSDCDNNSIWKKVNIACDKPIICQVNCVIAKQLRTDTWEFSNGINNVDIRKTDWEFGDGSNGTGSLVSHTYEQEGRYIVKMKVTNICNQVYTFQTSIDVTKPSTVADREYNTQIVEELDGKGPFHQISYFNKMIYTLAKSRSFYLYDPIQKTFASQAISPVTMNNNNNLFHDISELSLTNYGSNGSYYFENNSWKIWPFKNGMATDFLIAGYDCAPNGLHIPLELIDGFSIRFNKVTQNFYILGRDKKLYESRGISNKFDIINSIDYIDEYSTSLINNISGAMFFNFTSGIVMINSSGSVIKIFANLKFQSGPPKKIMIDIFNQIYSLDYNGNFARINQVTGSDELIRTKVNDFDLIHNLASTSIIICDNSSVTIMHKK